MSPLPPLQLAEGEYAPALSLLQLFAYGTLEDYRNDSSKYGTLSDAQIRKLRILTVAAMAVSRRTLPYTDLQRKLEIDTVRQLEDLLITECIYGNVIKGRLDQRARCFRVEDALTRDVQPEHLGDVVQALSAWLEGAKHVLGGIDSQVSNLAASMAAVEKQKAELEAEVDTARMNVRTILENKAAAEGAAMAIDEGDTAALLADFGVEGGEDRPSGPRNSKRRR